MPVLVVVLGCDELVDWKGGISDGDVGTLCGWAASGAGEGIPCDPAGCVVGAGVGENVPCGAEGCTGGVGGDVGGACGEEGGLSAV